MLNNFIYAKQKAIFEEKLNAGEILDEAIVFIEDTKEIWTHGTYFAAVPVNVSAFNNNVGYITEEQAVLLINNAIENAIAQTQNATV